MSRGAIIVLGAALIVAAAWLLGDEGRPEVPLDGVGEPTLTPGPSLTPSLAPAQVETLAERPPEVIDPAWLHVELQQRHYGRRMDVYGRALRGTIAYHKPLVDMLIRWLLSDNRVRIQWAGRLLRKMGPAIAADVRRLYSAEDPAVRLKAVNGLGVGRFGDGAGGPPVLDLLKDTDERVRTQTLRYVGYGIPYDEAVARHLLGLIDTVNGVAFAGPEDALARMGPEGIAHLVAMLEDPSGRLWLNALGGLRSARPEHLKPVLKHVIDKIRYDDEKVRRAAITVLFTLEGDCTECLPALRGALADESFIVVEAALMLLEQLGARAASLVGDVVKLLDWEDERIQTRAAGVLGQMQADPDRVMPELGRIVSQEASEAAATALAAFGPHALATALKVFDEGDDDARHAVMMAFARLGTSAATAVPRLLRVLQGDDELLRRRALYAIQFVGPEAAAAIPVILRQMGESEERLPAQWARPALMALGEPAEIALRQALRGTNATLKRQVAHVLSQSAGRTGFAMPELERLLSDKDDQTRRYVLQAISISLYGTRGIGLEEKADRARVARVCALLTKALEDASAENREYAKLALDEYDRTFKQ